ncbi:MAG TPA: HRDC domain-containing protein [Candidatus Binatia bacterium]|nr:HRDC domain-containing protein [Candidatus Binatia bacterium]
MEDVEALDTRDSEGYVYVRERAAMDKLIQRIAAAERVAVDTEADSLHSYFEKVCLVQLAFGGEHYLVDPLCDLDLTGFSAALAEKPLILHGGDYDLRMMRAAMGFRPRRDVFDTMIAAQLLGFEQIGLAALIERYFDIPIGKVGQKSDWSRRPLSENQLRYAVNDTRFLERLADRMHGELDDRGRVVWHRESCWAMVESSGRDHARDPENAWRIKGAGRLTRRQLVYLRELWRWRDEHARNANLPAFRVLANQEILGLVQWVESHPGVPLRQGPKLPRNIVGAQLTTLEEAITRAAGMDETEWPELRKRAHDAPRNDWIEEINSLRAECARIARELEIAASTLAPRAALEAIARSRPRTADEIMQTGGLLRWQAELVQGAVERCLHSIRWS